MADPNGVESTMTLDNTVQTISWRNYEFETYNSGGKLLNLNGDS